MNAMVSSIRMALGLACLTLVILAMAGAVGVLPDQCAAEIEGRHGLCRTLINLATDAARRDGGGIDAGLEAVRRAVSGNPMVLAVEAVDLRAPGHGPWDDTARLVLTQDGRTLGAMRLRFAPEPTRDGLLRGWSPEARFVAFFTVAGFCLETLYLWALLSRLEPEPGVPERVRATLDALSEGVLLLDEHQRVALANAAFARRLGLSPDLLVGRSADDLPWLDPAAADTGTAPRSLPWTQALRDGARPSDGLIGLRGAGDSHATLAVRATPIVDDRGAARGVLATFDDRTELRRGEDAIRVLVEQLRRARRAVRRQNRRLRAACGGCRPACLGRRAFRARLDGLWRGASPLPALGCVLVRLERVGALVARHGPDASESAARRIADAIHSAARDADAIGRPRPDAFWVLLPGADLAAAAAAAARFREAVAAGATRDLPLDVRFGIAERSADDSSPEAMFRRAERDLESAATAPTGAAPTADEPDARVSYHAVTSLVSALAYRDLSTAEHSRRVADLCVAVGRGLMSETACYLLEVGALLHDVGKLGVPDAVLRKPGPLNEAEWEVMGAHDRLGVEIIAAAFGSPELIAIVRMHHAWFGGTPRDPEMPAGANIPLGARILAVADSYDAMVSDRVYRKGRRRDDAFAELRGCAGAQFDPEVVERFIAVMTERHEAVATAEAQARPALSKRAAFRIGVQIERLAAALDTRDPATLGVMAARLRATAEQIGVPAIADVAAALSESLERPARWYRTLELTCELLELCRATQSTYLDTRDPSEGGPPAVFVPR